MVRVVVAEVEMSLVDLGRLVMGRTMAVEHQMDQAEMDPRVLGTMNRSDPEIIGLQMTRMAAGHPMVEEDHLMIRQMDVVARGINKTYLIKRIVLLSRKWPTL